MNKVWITATVLFFACLPIQARSADIYYEKPTLHLTGEIRPGDAEHFASVVAKEKYIFNFHINSLGGDVSEAIRIANLVKEMHLVVYVSDGGYCVSACFFILLEGYQRTFAPSNDDGNLPPQAVRNESQGYVGIHRPYQKAPVGDIASANRQEDLMGVVRSYLIKKAVPQHLIDEMMARPSNDIYWLNEHDKRLIGDFGPGDEEALVAKCGYKRVETQLDEGWSKERMGQLGTCRTDYWLKLYYPINANFIAKLRTGWRPWQTVMEKNNYDATTAKWREYGHSNELIAYIDNASITSDGDKVKMWILIDYRRPLTNMSETFLSEIDQNEFDCKGYQARRNYSINYSGNMGRGSQGRSGTVAENWVSPAAGSLLEQAWKIACKKK